MFLSIFSLQLFLGLWYCIFLSRKIPELSKGLWFNLVCLTAHELNTYTHFLTWGKRNKDKQEKCSETSFKACFQQSKHCPPSSWEVKKYISTIKKYILEGTSSRLLYLS